MRKLPLILGIVAIAVGAIFTGYSFGSTATTIPPPGNALALSPNIVGSGTLTITWSGAPSGTQVGFYDCGSNACSFTGTSATGCDGFPCTASGGPTKTVGGSSGSIQSKVQSGGNYAIAEVGANSGVSATYSILAITFAILVGVALMAVGVFLIVLARRPKRVRVSEMSEPIPNVTPPSEMVYSAPAPTPDAVTSAPTRMPQAFAEVPADGSAERRYFVQPSEATDEEGGAPAPAAPAPAAASATRQRPPLICPKCGTANDPWLTNCRRCQRSLKTTGQG